VNATVLPETLVRELTTAPAWRVQKEYAGVLFLLIELPADADGLLGPLLELASLDGEPLVPPSDLINTVEMVKIDPGSLDGGGSGPGRVEMLARLASSSHFALPLLKRHSGEPRARITVGRSASNDVVLTEPSVSAQHAWFELDEHGSLLIQDARSTNGTIVNGRRLETGEVTWIQPMDQIKFGSLSTFTCTPGVLRGVLKTLESDSYS
jgi:hypothetical protein